MKYKFIVERWLLLGGLDMGHSIQEWTKYNLWKTAFKIFEGIRKFYLVHS